MKHSQQSLLPLEEEPELPPLRTAAKAELIELLAELMLHLVLERPEGGEVGDDEAR